MPLYTTKAAGGGSTSPGGSSLQLQFNAAGSFAGMSGTSWNDTTRTLTLTDGAGKTLTLNSNDLAFNSAGTAYVSNGNETGSIKLGVGGNADGLTVNADKTVTFYSSLSAPSFISAGSYLQAGTGIAMPANGWIQYNAGMTLVADATNQLALRNGASAQAFNIYNTWTDASNYERGVYDWTTSASTFSMGTTKAGTGASRPFQFLYGGTRVGDYSFTNASAWTFMSDIYLRNILFSTDAVYNIGTNGAYRPYRGYFANRVYMDDLCIPTNGVWANSDAASYTAGVAQDAWIKRIAPGTFRVGSSSGGGVGVITTAATTVASLPAAATAGAGARGFVTDSTLTASGNFGAAVTGGGTNKVPVYSDGTGWFIG